MKLRGALYACHLPFNQISLKLAHKIKKILEWKLTLHAQKASLLQEIKVRYTYD